MSEAPNPRIEPSLDSAGNPAAVVSSPPLSQAIPTDRLVLDQLARIEDKLARVEEKYARSEALLLRVEDRVEHTTGVAGGLARQQDLEQLSGRVGRLPGFGALILTAIIAGIFAAVFTVAAQRYGIPGLTP